MATAEFAFPVEHTATGEQAEFGVLERLKQVARFVLFHVQGEPTLSEHFQPETEPRPKKTNLPNTSD